MKVFVSVGENHDVYHFMKISKILTTLDDALLQAKTMKVTSTKFKKTHKVTLSSQGMEKTMKASLLALKSKCSRSLSDSHSYI